MTFHCFAPSADLQEFITCYAYYRIDKEDVPEGIRCVPAGACGIALNRGQAFTVYNDVFPGGIPQDGNLLVGQQKRFYTMVPSGFFHHFCVLFKPTGLYRLFGQSVDDLTNKAAPLEAFLAPFAQPPFAAINRWEVTDTEPFIEQLEELLHAHVAGGQTQQRTAVDDAVDMILATKGMVTVSELAEQAAVSLRNFRRMFTRMVGINPKGFIKGIRLQNIMRIMKDDPASEQRWSQIALEYGYYDQAHFIKEFKDFCGLPPVAYLRRITQKEHAFERYFLALTAQ